MLSFCIVNKATKANQSKMCVPPRASNYVGGRGGRGGRQGVDTPDRLAMDQQNHHLQEMSDSIVNNFDKIEKYWKYVEKKNQLLVFCLSVSGFMNAFLALLWLAC